MKLPKLSSPIFELTLPSNGQVIKYRPYSVEEEKILLIAQQANEIKESILAIRQVVNNCLLDDIDVNSIPIFDLEWCYLQLRIKSVSDFVDIYIIDKDDKSKHEVSIDLKEIKVVNLDNQKTRIDLDPGVGIIMKYPTYELLEVIQKMDFKNIDDLFEIIYLCMEMIYDEENIYPVQDVNKDELREWLQVMQSSLFGKIVDFFEDMPKIQHKLHYTNKAGELKEVVLEGVADFFL